MPDNLKSLQIEWENKGKSFAKDIKGIVDLPKLVVGKTGKKKKPLIAESIWQSPFWKQTG